jgi:lipid A disaccharide synthetase
MLVIFRSKKSCTARPACRWSSWATRSSIWRCPVRDRETTLRAAGLDPGRPVVALLPGSRPNELHQILPTLAESALLMSREQPGVQFLIARAPALADSCSSPSAR